MRRIFLIGVILWSFFLTLTATVNVFSQEIKKNSGDTPMHAMIMPRSYTPLETKTSLSVLFTKLPFDWVETSVELPVFQVNNKLGLPAGFTLESSLQTLFISNQIRTGPHWNVEAGKFSFGAGLDGAFMFGFMKIAGFNNKTKGWSTYPNITAGFRTKDLSFVLNAEGTFINSLKISSGDEEILHSKNFLSGGTLSFYIEQPFWKNRMMIIGVVNNFQKFWFPAWPAFSTFNRHYYIPQFYVGLVL